MPRDRDEEIRAVRGSLQEAACAGSLGEGQVGVWWARGSNRDREGGAFWEAGTAQAKAQR